MRSTTVDFPAPGGPVIPMRRARPSVRCTPESRRSNPGRAFSTTEIARASAAVLPAVRSASRRSGSMAEKSPRTWGEASGALVSARLAVQPLARGLQRRVHVAEEILLADLVQQAGAAQREERLGVYIAQEHLGALLPCPPDQILECVHGGGVDRRHVAHPDHEDAWF